MKKSLVLSLLVVFALGLGCAQVTQPVNGSLFQAVKGPVSAGDSTAEATKQGTAQAMSILGLAGFGDASIEQAMANGDITKVHHVDYEGFSVLGLFAQYKTIVYGE